MLENNLLLKYSAKRTLVNLHDCFLCPFFSHCAGGRRCMELECNKSAADGTGRCKAHGGLMLDYHFFFVSL